MARSEESVESERREPCAELRLRASWTQSTTRALVDASAFLPLLMVARYAPGNGCSALTTAIPPHASFPEPHPRVPAQGRSFAAEARGTPWPWSQRCFFVGTWSH